MDSSELPSSPASLDPVTPLPTPATPKLPLSPPRRRSSLAFSQILPHFTSPRSKKGENEKDAERHLSSPNRNVPNTGRKRTAYTPNVTSPGHVARMQKLFQDAKASFRIDLRFASSPIGSIGSRIPAAVVEHASPGESQVLMADESEGKVQKWRFSTAPLMLAGVNLDVREPFPETDKPFILPDLMLDNMHNSLAEALEPVSSGFNSPANGDHLNILKSPSRMDRPGTAPATSTTQDFNSQTNSDDSNSKFLTSGVERSLSHLKIGLKDQRSREEEESPTVSHLRRRSGNISDSIFLSVSAEAAAASAKMKRDLLRGAKIEDGEGCSQPHRVTSFENSRTDSRSTASQPTSERQKRRTGLICPDPDVHYLTDGANARQSLITPSPRVSYHLQTHPMAYVSPQVARQPFTRANARGSPMPFMRPGPKISIVNRPELPQGVGRPSPSRPQALHAAQTDLPFRREIFTVSEDEHFQPGWQFADENLAPQNIHQQFAYSFSTAAAKKTGASAAPDLQIRDSYRTDTLTPLSRPPARFKKTGLAADISARAGGPSFPAFADHQSNPQRPLQVPYAQRSLGPSLQRKQIDDRNWVARRKNQPDYGARRLDPAQAGFEVIPTIKAVSQHQHGSDVDVMEVDDDTRAAIRMSLYETTDQARTSEVKRLSPNVTMVRRKTRKRQRQWRRPSYWDEDLEEVCKSPAGRPKPALENSDALMAKQASTETNAEFHNDHDTVSKSQKGTDAGTDQEESKVEVEGRAESIPTAEE